MSQSTEFLTRLFQQNSTRWWESLHSETPKKSNSELLCLESSLENEFSDFPEYRNSGRRLFFFSTSNRSTIDGRFKNVGVEEKLNPLDLEEHLIDGAIHRGIIWVVGNPQNVHPVESVSLYMLERGCPPMSAEATDLYFPILSAIYQLGIQVVFINGTTGAYWGGANIDNADAIPQWLSQKDSPMSWDLKLDRVTDLNRRALDELAMFPRYENIPGESRPLPGMRRAMGKAHYKSLVVDDSCKVAVVENGNQWRVIEYGLILRAAGYHAVRSIYNRAMHKNRSDRSRVLRYAGLDVETRVANLMRDRFSIVLDWQIGGA
jgi:hypothetical protein